MGFLRSLQQIPKSTLIFAILFPSTINNCSVMSYLILCSPFCAHCAAEWSNFLSCLLASGWNRMLRWTSALVVVVTTLYFMDAANSCNEAVCASVVSKCMLTQSCKCDLKNCSCCKDCFSCLGELYSECCSCVGQ